MLGRALAARMTAVPRLASSRAKGSIPSTMSALQAKQVRLSVGQQRPQRATQRIKCAQLAHDGTAVGPKCRPCRSPTHTPNHAPTIVNEHHSLAVRPAATQRCHQCIQAIHDPGPGQQLVSGVMEGHASLQAGGQFNSCLTASSLGCSHSMT